MFSSDLLLSLLLLLLINLAVIFRRIRKLTIPAWTAFLGAALILIFLDNHEYEKAIKVLGNQSDVFIFLFGMFVLVSSLEMSGTLDNTTKKLLGKAKSLNTLLLIIIFGFGFAAAILINDTVAILAPIILIILARQLNLDPKPMILIVTFSLTFGSAILPIGNPQNFILTVNGGLSFLEFSLLALIPSLIILFFCFIFFKYYFRKELNNLDFSNAILLEENYEFSHLEKPALIAFSFLIIGLIFSSLIHIRMAIIILLIVGSYLFLMNDRDKILARIDWGILFFFAGMFIVIDYVTSNETIKNFLSNLFSNSVPTFSTFLLFIFTIFIGSQIISNVPMAVIISNILPNSPLDIPIFWIGAALTCTFAGATTVLGAASNVIVIETASKRGINISWIEFAKIGIPLSVISLIGVIILGYLIL